MRRLHLLLFALVALLFASCSSDDDYVEEVEIVGDYTYGMFVLNEGNFNAGNTEISFIDDMFTGVTNNIYRLRSEEHTSELQSRGHLVCRLLLEKTNRKSTKCNA